MNKVQLTGRLTRDPESRKAGEATVASFTIATNEGKYHDRDLTQFIPCEAWGKDAETILARFHKGDGIIVTDGRIVVDSWEKDGQKRKSVAVGDGPVDAAFLAIEQIIGHHYELDDFQIQTVTEGREAMGSALVKLRAGGKLYSGNGISTDIIGASIRAYISALNKIVYEEA